MRKIEELIDTTCGFCKKELKVHPYRFRKATVTKQVFCSRLCKRNYQYYISHESVGMEKYEYNSLPKQVRAMAVYISRADQRKGLYANHDLTIEYLYDLWEKQSRRCAYTNIELRLYIAYAGNTPNPNSKIYTASLDRIDSSKGYVQGNVQFVSTAINYMKNDMTDKETKELVILIKMH